MALLMDLAPGPASAFLGPIAQYRPALALRTNTTGSPALSLVAAGISIPGLFLLTGIASLAVAALFWRLLPQFSAAPEPVPGEAAES
jgi:hypothetical protein